MLLVLNNVNDNMHQIGITGFHVSYNLSVRKKILYNCHLVVFRVIGMTWVVYFYKDHFLYGLKIRKIC